MSGRELMLTAEIEVALGAFHLEAELDAEAGSTLVLVGESGAGKTTILNLLAGLHHPDRGRIRVDGQDYFASAEGIAVPAHEREVAYLFQDYALFPHLTVAGNVAFGLRAQGRAEGEVGARVGAMLKRLTLASLAGSLPGQLSGGQQQRVALARALVLEPKLLLLDEPLSALDPRTQRGVRSELRELIQAFSGVTLFVTHSPLEALAFGERIGVVENGRISQLGPREELLRHPRSRYVAELVGVNFFRGRVDAVSGGIATVKTPHGEIHVLDVVLGDEVFVAVEPHAITLHLEGPRGTAQNVFRGPIAEIAPEPPYGDRVRVVIDSQPALVAEITAHAVDTMGLRLGLEVYASFKASAARAYA